MDDYVPMSEEMLAAKRRNDPDAVLRLLENGEDPNADDEDMEPLLGWAAWRGHTDIVRFLLDKGMDIDTRGYEGETALTNASSQGHAKTVALLIERGADVNLVERNGGTALGWAKEEGYEQIVAALLAAGALEDASETLDERQREQEEREQYARDLELARREFSSRAQNHEAAKAWVGAWAHPLGPGTATLVFHADGTVISCGGNRTREVAHLDDPDDGTLFYRLPNGITKIERWSVSEEGRRLTLDYGNFVATFERL